MTSPDTAAPARLRPLHRPLPFVTLRVTAALVLREMASTYGNKPGGYIWAVLEPVASIMILTWIFSLGFRNPALGSDFAIFYATGIMPFMLFTKVSHTIGRALRFSRPLMSYPRVTVVDVVAARFVLNLLLQLLISYIVLGGIIAWNDTGTILELPRILLGFAMATALGLGVGMFNCVPLTLFPIYQTVWMLVSRPLLLFSGVLFLPESLPRTFREYLLWNPLVHATSQVRSGFYFGYHPDYVDPTYVFVFSAVAFAAGILITWRFHRLVLDR